MDLAKLTRRAAARTAVALCWIAWAAAGSLLSARAHADCLANPVPGIRALQALSAADPVEAVRQAGRRLSAALRAKSPDVRRMASLYAVLAQSDSRLELDADARAAARKGLALLAGERDPVRLDLLAAYAENVYDKDGIQRALRTIADAHAAQPVGSVAATCLKITQGLLEYRMDHLDRRDREPDAGVPCDRGAGTRRTADVGRRCADRGHARDGRLHPGPRAERGSDRLGCRRTARP